MDFKKKSYLYFVFVLSAFALVFFVSASYNASAPLGATEFTLPEDTSKIYNITINNSDLGVDANITQINITFNVNFTISIATNATNALALFTNLSNNLSWTNSTSLVPYSTTRQFWINATGATPGSYDLIILIVNSTTVLNQNLTIYITDISPVISNVSNSTVGKANSTITWSTNLTSNYTVFYRRSHNLSINFTSHNSSYLFNHTLTLTNLTSATRYSYNVLSCDANNNCNTSDTYIFTTQSFVFNTSFMNYTDGEIRVYNFTINNTDPNNEFNFTQINVTLPDGLNFTASSQFAITNTEFTNTTTELSWTNNSGILLSNTSISISFNASARTNMEEWYNFTVKLYNPITGVSYNNVSFRIHDDTAPIINTTVLTATNIDADSARITWTTNEPANSTVCYNADDNTPSCSDNAESETSYVTNHDVSLTDLQADMTYDYEVMGCDVNNNCAALTSADKEFLTDEDDDDSNSGGGGGGETGYWSATNSYSDKEMQERGNLNVSLALRERARIKIENDRYYVGVTKISSSSVTINVTDAKELWLSDKYSKGDSKKYEVTGDAYYDLEVVVNDIKSSKANITIKYLHELKSNTLDRPTFNDTDLDVNVTQNNSDPGIFGSGGLKSEPTRIVLFILIAIIVLLIIGFIINRVGKAKTGKDDKEEQGLLSKVKQEIKAKTAKHFAKGKVNVKHP